jgi:hypothetical protein
MNGRCNEIGVAVAICGCTYDQCAGDRDCPQGETCACHDSPFAGGAGNTCIAGNCRVDADCGAGGYCSPSPNPMACGGLEGYFCRTPNDACVDDADCIGNAFQGCAYDRTSNRWICQELPLCL